MWLLGILGINFEWWIVPLVLCLWIIYFKFSKTRFLILIILFFVDLHINHLFSIVNFRPSFDLERINISSPVYIRLIDKYRYDDVTMPYRLRNIFYSNWLTVFYWIDSTLKIMSPRFWIELLGLSGTGLFFVGLFSVEKKYIYWWLTVMLASGLGILVDTKLALILSLPVIVVAIVKSLKLKYVKHYWWIVGLLFIVDFLLK